MQLLPFSLGMVTHMAALSDSAIKKPRHIERPWYMLDWQPWMNMSSSLLNTDSDLESRGLQIILALSVSPDASTWSRNKPSSLGLVHILEIQNP